MIRVVLADNQPLVGKGLTSLLGADRDLEVASVAGDGGEALELLRERHPGVACLDIRKPKENGVEVARAVQNDTVEVLMLTTFALDEYVSGALGAGVAGFLLKISEPGVIKQTAAGHGTIAQSLTRRILCAFDERRRQQPVAARSESLAVRSLMARELDILRLLARGMSNADIATILNAEPSTMKSHLARMLPKLGVVSRLQTVVGPTRTESSHCPIDNRSNFGDLTYLAEDN